MKLALGTVQFGVDYGVAGGAKVPADEVAGILAAADAAGIDTLDTAAAYGSSESVIGAHLGAAAARMRIVTKVPPLDGADDPVVALREGYRRSLQRLGVARCHGLLLHRAGDLRGAQGPRVLAALQDLRDDGLVARIGISAVGPEDLDLMVEHEALDLVQVPFSVLDQRVAADERLRSLHARGVEVHSRSAFLQGLLLLPQDDLPSYFDRWRGELEAGRTWCRTSGVAPAAALLQFALRQPFIDRVVVGVDGLAQFRELVEATASTAPLPPADELACDDPGLVVPSRWPR